jgi:tryptophanyl-tRNA synthetase
MSRVFSGIQPTGGGVPHLGNYLGALQGYTALQAAGHDTYFCVVDQHATTVPYDHRALGEACLSTAAALVACGVDPARSVLYRQSAVPGHSLLSQVLGHVATLGPLERMTQFKEKGRESEGAERDSIGLGLLTYPVLMAADILLFHGELVPVGEDQHQHLQLAGDLARRFNHRYGVDYFKRPRKVFREGAARIMSLHDPLKKMSKSDPAPGGAVYLTDDAAAAAGKYRRATSDPDPLPSEPGGLEGRPAAANLVGILAALTGRSAADVLAELGGRGFSALKAALVEAHEARIVPIGNRMRELMDDRGALRAILRDGAARADAVARATVAEVYDIVGFA